MKRIWYLILLAGLSGTIQAQQQSGALSTQTDTLSLNQLEQKGVKIVKVKNVSATKEAPKIISTVIDTANISIDNVVLKDLPGVKQLDSLWLHTIYQPVLFDSIQDIKQSLDSLNVVQFTLDTVDIKKKIELLNQKTQLNIVYHPALVRTIKVFLKNRKKSLGRLFGMAKYYFPIFEEKLAKYDIPLEMKYLAIVESALNPKAISRAGAGGLWQFMYATGKVYGLEINSYVDERFAPIQETEAACKHMQDLYKVFKDWNLVLAAYNSGAGNVTKAIRRSGGYKNYWNIRPYLPRETAGYVPLFQATWFLGEYAADYGIVPENPPVASIATDTIVVKHTITFDQISRLLKIPEQELEFLNPQYKLGIIPYVADKNYTLKLPLDLTGVFVNNEDLIYALVQKELDKKEKPLPKFYKLRNYLVYRVRSGDYLGRIARKFHTSVRRIKRMNGLRSNRLRVGQKLKIYARYPVAVNNSGHSIKSKKNNKKRGKALIYKVKEGDTLWNISRKYKVSLSEILQWNKLKHNSKLKPGMKLRIYKS